MTGIKKTSIKLNIGCGPTGQINGFVNLDNSPSVLLAKAFFIKKILFATRLISKQQYNHDWSGVTYCDVSRGIPYPDKSVDKIYTSHFIEHIPEEKGLYVLKECFRVLKSDGIMRIVLPDLFVHASQYIRKMEKILSESAAPNDRAPHDDFLKTVYGAFLKKKRFGAEHCYMYDLPTIVSALESVGFKHIKPCDFRKGTDQELASLDARPEDSMHIEVIR